MPIDNEWLNLEQTVERHESDLDSQRKEITKLKNTLPLLAEAIECLHLYTLRGITHALAAQKAGNRLIEIIAILKATFTNRDSFRSGLTIWDAALTALSQCLTLDWNNEELNTMPGAGTFGEQIIESCRLRA